MKPLSSSSPISTVRPSRFAPAGALGTAALVLAAFMNNAQAHPGHAVGEHGASHLVTSPYHLAILAGVGLLLWGSAKLVQRPLVQRVLQLGGCAAMIVAAVAWGIRM